MEKLRFYGEIEAIPDTATWEDLELRARDNPVIRMTVDSVRAGHYTREEALIRLALWCANEMVRHHDQVVDLLNTQVTSPIIFPDGSAPKDFTGAPQGASPYRTATRRRADDVPILPAGEGPRDCHVWPAAFGDYMLYSDHQKIVASASQASGVVRYEINDGNIFIFCDHVERRSVNDDYSGCIRGAGHNGPHVFAGRNHQMMAPVTLAPPRGRNADPLGLGSQPEQEPTR